MSHKQPKSLENRLEIIQKIKNRIDEDTKWAVIGSTGLFLQGVDVEPHDIDIITDRKGAFKIGEEFREHVKKPVEYSENGRFRSYYGKLEIKGIEVEVMGELEKKVRGRWDGIEKLEKMIVEKDIQGNLIPVIRLEKELEEYNKMGRTEKADKIRKKLEKR